MAAGDSVDKAAAQAPGAVGATGDEVAQIAGEVAGVILYHVVPYSVPTGSTRQRGIRRGGIRRRGRC